MNKKNELGYDFLCRAPWRNLYYRKDLASPCYAFLSPLCKSPVAYLESPELQSVKQDFINGDVPPACQLCYTREKLGLKSTRQSIYKYGMTELDKDRSKLSIEPSYELRRLEVRFSNQCNFKCRMCTPIDSSQITQELNENPRLLEIDNIYQTPYKNNSLPAFQIPKRNTVRFNTDLNNIDELKNLIKKTTIKQICLTGGEPTLIKAYSDFLDFIIENGYNENTHLMIFTNCSVLNPIFYEKVSRFSQVTIIMSLDGVGKVAEYIRHGTDWDKVKQNVVQLTGMPFNIGVNLTLSSLSLLGMADLTKFIVNELYPRKNNECHCYTVVNPEWLFYANTPSELKIKIIDQIDQSIEILSKIPDNSTPPRTSWNRLVNELTQIKQQLQTVITDQNKVNYFIEKNKELDKIRNQSFENVFGYKLY